MPACTTDHIDAGAIEGQISEEAGIEGSVIEPVPVIIDTTLVQ